MKTEASIALPLYCAGHFETTDETSRVTNPWDDTHTGEAAMASPVLLERAIEAATGVAREQFRLPRYKKSEQCLKVAEALAAAKEDFAQLIVRESGKPLQYARGEVDRAVITFKLAASEAMTFVGEQLPLEISPAGEGLAGYTERVPMGPVAAIAPFNFPLNLVAHKIAPALAVGVPIVLKPARQTPLTALRLAEVIHEAEALPGSVSIMPMKDELAESLVRDDRLGVFSFTGSAKVGWALKAKAGRKRVLLELGGNAPAIVHDDADFDWAIKRLAAAGFASAGQVCIKAQRIYVQRSRYPEFREKYVAAARALTTGDPANPDTVVGPLIDSAAADRVMQWVSEAVEDGASVLTGHTRKGNVMDPTVLENVPQDHRCAREEIFGPVVLLEPYDTIDDAIRMANASEYGLQAALFTFDTRILDQVTEQLDFGGIIINDSPMVRLDNYPYGGAKASGIGREGVRYTMEEYTQTKAIIRRRPAETH